jgi:hypothetical protein
MHQKNLGAPWGISAVLRWTLDFPITTGSRQISLVVTRTDVRDIVRRCWPSLTKENTMYRVVLASPTSPRSAPMYICISSFDKQVSALLLLPQLTECPFAVRDGYAACERHKSPGRISTLLRDLDEYVTYPPCLRTMILGLRETRCGAALVVYEKVSRCHSPKSTAFTRTVSQKGPSSRASASPAYMPTSGCLVERFDELGAAMISR